MNPRPGRFWFSNSRSMRTPAAVKPSKFTTPDTFMVALEAPLRNIERDYCPYSAERFLRRFSFFSLPFILKPLKSRGATLSVKYSANVSKTGQRATFCTGHTVKPCAETGLELTYAHRLFRTQLWASPGLRRRDQGARDSEPFQGQEIGWRYS